MTIPICDGTNPLAKPPKGTLLKERHAKKIEYAALKAALEGPYQQKATGDTCPEWLRSKVMERDGFACIMCGATKVDDDARLEVDRIIPGAQGGRYVEENVACLCAKCNRAKGARRMKVYEQLVRRHKANLEGTPERRCDTSKADALVAAQKQKGRRA